MVSSLGKLGLSYFIILSTYGQNTEDNKKALKR